MLKLLSNNIFSLYTHPWTFSAIRSMSSNCGLEMNMTLAMLGGIVKVPPYNGYIFTTPYSSSKLYLATRPIGPANDWSHIIAYAKDRKKRYNKSYKYANLTMCNFDSFERRLSQRTFGPSHFSNRQSSRFLACSWMSPTFSLPPVKYDMIAS